MKADAGGGGGEGHGSRHSDSQRMIILPAMPTLSGCRTYLYRKKTRKKNMKFIVLYFQHFNFSALNMEDNMQNSMKCKW